MFGLDENAVTFDYVYECWKSQDYPEDFDDLLDKYLEKKKEVFSNADVGSPTAWLNKILIAIEIGILRDPPRFMEHREYWSKLLCREWKVSVEDRWVTWA